MEIKGRHIVIETYHPLKLVMELEVEDLRLHSGKVLRGESKVEGGRGEVSHRDARHPPPSIVWVLWEIEPYRE